MYGRCIETCDFGCKNKKIKFKTFCDLFNPWSKNQSTKSPFIAAVCTFLPISMENRIWTMTVSRARNSIWTPHEKSLFSHQDSSVQSSVKTTLKATQSAFGTSWYLQSANDSAMGNKFAVLGNEHTHRRAPTFSVVAVPWILFFSVWFVLKTQHQKRIVSNCKVAC